MNIMTSGEIREQFLQFFQERGHQIVPSAPIVVKDDPTLMFTNAGMNQFKDIFLGNKKITHHEVADTQKCLRVSGKHNDLEEVGVDTYHHTMFEMLGNWSFGDPENPEVGYFKKEAIQWSWELLHNVYGIPADMIYATIFEGDPDQGIPMDQESFDEWLKYLPAERILKGSKKDNFWEMGDTGPCGPCTEIHVDCRSAEEKDDTPGAALVNKDHPQVIELWNNVFIQYNRSKDGSLELLPARHVDTGMGFERLVRVIQGKASNYDTDLFEPLLHKIAEITNFTYTAGMSKTDIAFRVLADHIRAIGFTISDGQMPSNTGAGYVIRRILRRAIRYYFSFLEYKQPLMAQLVPILALQFKNVFPELYKQMDFVQKAIYEEEVSFLRTLEQGIKRFEQFAAESKEVMAGDKLFELMDTFGFPLDLSVLMAQEHGLSIDHEGFEKALQLQKDRSRMSAQIETGDWVVLDAHSESIFVGYNALETSTQVTKYRAVQQKEHLAYHIVLKETPFYAESGGQVGDTGILRFGDQIIQVINTKRENELIIHWTTSLPEDVKTRVIASVDSKRRQLISVNHTATHLLHAALRSIMGDHVVQKGSLVNENYLRFDFAHFAKLTNEEISAVEHLVQQKIRENIPVTIQYMSKDEALATGAMALFGEKYGDTVRVVIIDAEYSIELCGGTHIVHTGEIGHFKITSESAIAAGVRRIESLTGAAAVDWSDDQLTQLNELKQLMGHPKDLAAKLQDLIQSHKTQAKELETYELEKVNTLQQSLLSTVEKIAGMNIIIAKTNLDNTKHLKNIGFNLSRSLQSGLILIANTTMDKVTIQINITDDIIQSRQLNAGNLIKIAAAHINGGGGGQAGFATAGGDLPSGIDPAIDAIKAEISGLIS